MTSPFYSFFATPRGTAPLVLRLILFMFFAYHGSQKLLGWFGGAGWSETIRLWTESGQMPATVAMIAIIAEIFIAVSLLFGLFTRLAGAVTVVLMGGAMYYFPAGTPIESIELPFLILAVGLALVFSGGGSLSLDRGISQALLPDIGYVRPFAR